MLMHFEGREWSQEEAAPLSVDGKCWHMWESKIPLAITVFEKRRKCALGFDFPS